MRYSSYTSPTVPAEVQISHFVGDSGAGEYHLVAHPTAQADFDTQLDWVARAYREALAAVQLDVRTALLRRFFCSDVTRQAAALAAQPVSNPDTAENPCAVSWVGMPPASPALVALWAYHVNDPGGPLRKSRDEGTLVWQRDGLAHRWTTGLTGTSGHTPYDQTRAAFAKYDAFLQARQISWSTEVLRTWLFVRNIDANYAGVVAARREFFTQRGLTPQTHFIASTGIEGTGVNPAAAVTLDAYTIQGVRPRQITFLAAPDHLGPTHVYGVTFERGVAIAYRDRRHILISGTASIDPQGQIVHPGDVERQVDRTLANITALLRAAGAELRDMGVFVAYVRNPGDCAFVLQRMREHCGAAPIEVLVAPICRPGWLVEVEGMAIVPASQPDLPTF
jgi:enamine deaminase RidA (YjgF/YER057c/UK114 family)